MGKSKDVNVMKDRIIAAVRASNHDLVSCAFFQKATMIRWPKLLKVVESMVNDGILEKLSTTSGPMYRLK